MRLRNALAVRPKKFSRSREADKNLSIDVAMISVPLNLRLRNPACKTKAAHEFR